MHIGEIFSHMYTIYIYTLACEESVLCVCENYEVERQRHNKQINYTYMCSYSGTI